MKITGFRIENFRNLRLVECDDVPDLMVICGGNGCGKSALLEALMTAKEAVKPYGRFNFDKRVVSSDSEIAVISMKINYSENERNFLKERFNLECPETDEIAVEIKKDGNIRVLKSSNSTNRILGYYSSTDNSPGFFDYINVYRRIPKFKELRNWDANYLKEDRAKETLASEDKFRNTKEYLASLKMRDIQHLEASHEKGDPEYIDSLKDIKVFFNSFFKPMIFENVLLHTEPFSFIIKAPSGEIDIDDLSSGEKEILNIFIRFHQLNPSDSIILYDEVDSHLHPDLQRRYLSLLRKIGKNNQLILTTHAPEIMIETGSESLFTILKEPSEEGENQLVRVTETSELHEILSELMGSRGLVSINKKIIFIEGEESSADKMIFENFYPPNEYNISFVPAGNSSTVSNIAEKINELLSCSTGFQEYYSIIDGDIRRSLPPPDDVSRLFQLPVYHIENFLLDTNELFSLTSDILKDKNPYASEEELISDIHELILQNIHLKSYTRAVLDSKLASLAKEAFNTVLHERTEPIVTTIPEFQEVEQEAKKDLSRAIEEDNWRAKCKGRDLLKAFCAKHQFRYVDFRNLLLTRINEPPRELQQIMSIILGV